MRLLKIVLISALFCLLVPFLFAETIILSGTQTKQGQFFSSKLESDPVNIPQAGKITRVEGEHKGFWINKKNDYRVEKTYRFYNSLEAKDTTLGPGTYTVYPNLPSGESKARVKVYVELGGGQDTPTERSSSSDSLTFYRNYCKVYVPIQSRMYKDMDEETYEAMRSAGSIFASVDECIDKSFKAEQQYYSMCLDEGKSESECNKFLKELKEMYRQLSTRQGCTNMYKGFCGFYNLEGMEGVPEDYKTEQDKVYRECIANVDSSCRGLPESISW